MQTNLNGSVLASLFISAIVFHTEKFVAVSTPDSALIWTVREIELGIETERRINKIVRELYRERYREPETV